jgi:hypothetical protein
MARREYKGAATPTTLSANINNSATSLTITDSTNWPTGSFSLVIDPGLAGEEKILATSRSGTTVTLTTRGYDNTSASTHTTGAVIYPVPTAVDFDEANAHVNASTGVHGLSGAVVGTTDTQTLTNKSLSDSTVSIVDVADATKAIKFDIGGTTSVTGTITTAFTTAKTVTIPDATDTLVGKATTDTLTNKTLTSPTINTPKTYIGYTAKTAAYTVGTGDEGYLFSMNNAATQQFNIPTDATFNFAIGTVINFVWITGAGQPTIGATTPGTTTISSTAGVTPKLRVANSAASAIKLAANSWLVVGDIA